MGWEIRPNPSLTKFTGLRARNSSLIDWTSNPEEEDNKGLGLV